MGNKLSISIAMCTYNGAKYLSEQLESINKQILLPDELIVCDDGSSDETVDLVKSFAEASDFPVKLFVNKENLGSTKNFEKAIQLCSGSIIVLTDQDDVWTLDKLSTIEDIFVSQTEIGMIFSDAQMIDDFSNSLDYKLWDYLKFNKKEQALFDLTPEVITSLFIRKNVVAGATMCFRAEFKEDILPIAEGWIHDAWISILLASHTKIRVVDRPLIMYRQHARQQLGAKNHSRGVRQDIIAIRNSKNDIYAKQKAAYELLLNTMERGNSCSDGVIALVKNKIKHLERRKLIENNIFLLKILYVFIELINGRYHKYSSGWKSSIKDLIT